MFSRFFKKVSLVCIGYHSIRPDDLDNPSYSKIVVRTSDFERQLKFLKKEGYRFVSLEDIVNNLGRTVEENLALIYFDDGYKDVLDFASPILKRENIKATVFLVTDFVNGKKNPWDEENIFMNWNDILKEKNNFDFGSHTVSHQKLAKLSSKNVFDELSQSKEEIENKLGQDVLALSYPHSSFNKEVQKISLVSGYKVTIGNGNFKNHKVSSFLGKTKPNAIKNL